MSIAFILNPGYNTINNIHHTFWDQGADCVANDSLNQALEVSTSVSAPVHNVGETSLSIGPVTGGLVSTAPQFEVPIVITNQVNTDSLLETTLDAGITVYNDLHLDSKNIDGVTELTCGTLHYTTLDPAIAGDASAWSTFPATQDVNLAGNYLVNNSGQDIKLAQPILSVGVEGGGPNKSAFTSFGTSSDAGITFATSNDDLPNATGCSLSVRGKDFPKEFSFTTDPSAAVLSAASGDLVLISDTSAKIRLTYGLTAPDKAISIASSGAIAFDTEYNDTAPIIEGSYGTAGQILSSQGSALPPQWVAAPTASNWSTYDATSNVDLVSNTLTSSTDLIKLDKDTTISKPLNTTFTVSALDSTSANGGSVIFATAGADAASYSQFAMGCNSGKQDSKGVDGFLTTAGAGVMQTADGRELIFLAGSQNSLTTSNIRFAYDGSKKAYTINKDGALNFDADWNGSSPIIEGSFGTSGQVIQSNGSAAAPSWVSLPVSSQYVYYVSKDGTVGASGDVNHPLSTIQAAITLGQAAYPRQVVILIAPGVYSETLSITLPNITLSGYSISQQQNLMTQIVGNVGVSCSASQDLFYSQVCFQNLQISGLLYDNSSVVHTLNVEGCRISANGAVFAQLSTADNRTRLTRCTILQSSETASTDPILKFSSGLITLSLLDVTARNNAPVLQFDGSAKLQACGLCTFESNTTSATAAPIVYISPTSAAGYTYAFGYNSFSYPSLVPRSFSSGKNCGIVLEAGTGHPTLIITYNVFNLLLCDATCFVVQDVKKADAAAYTDIRFFSNSSTYLATGIDSTHKTTLAAVA